MSVQSEEQRKWEFLKRAPIDDAKTAEIIELARPLMLVARASPWRDWCFSQLALALARDCIRYQLDSDRVGREQIDGYTDPQPRRDEPLRRGTDDCDAKARFFVALCLSMGVVAEMVDRWKGDRLTHVYAKCFVQGPGEPMPRWYFCETILRRARLGDVAEDVPKETETGKWLF